MYDYNLQLMSYNISAMQLWADIFLICILIVVMIMHGYMCPMVSWKSK